MIPTALLAAAALAAASPSGGATAANARTPCILVGQSDTHYTPVDDHTIVVSSARRWWKLTTTPSPFMDFPTSFLVNTVRGTSTLCSPVDFDLKVADSPGGVQQGLIVQDFVAITPQEGAALRRAARR